MKKGEKEKMREKYEDIKYRKRRINKEGDQGRRGEEKRKRGDEKERRGEEKKIRRKENRRREKEE